ncbi:MAG: prolyl oligopeptidase family serine peptidase [Candidatus Gracilibacteria bacterium]|nr:prolyl oligopeptidase family serine peptidase [Candidatus Gracilibacteria bacterium]
MQIIRFGEIVGNYSRSEKGSDTLFIYASGMPSIPCPNMEGYEKLINESGYDFFAPDYYGFFRSGKTFTPQSNIDTLLDTKNHFENSGKIQDVFSGEYSEIKYKNFVFVGESWGGGVVSLMPKFDKNIKNIALINPVFEYNNDLGYDEEKIEDFLGVIDRGFKNLLRGFGGLEWEKHFQDSSGLTPTKNMKYLKACNVFLTHGDADDVINVNRARDFYEKLKNINPAGQFNYLEIPGGIHFGDLERQTGVISFSKLIKFFENKLK